MICMVSIYGPRTYACRANHTLDSGNFNEHQSIMTNDAEPPKKTWIKRIMYRTLRLFLIAYATVLGALLIFETALVYPGAYMKRRPQWEEPEGSSLETPVYETSDGVKLQGLLVHRGPDKPVVVFFHGNAEKAAWQGSFLRSVSNHLDANVLAAEFRGFVGDTPKPNEAGVLLDCQAARKYMMERYNVRADQIILYGRSLGGGCAVAMAADGGAKALVLERTFDQLVNVAASKFWFVPVKTLMRNRYNSVKRLEKYEGPIIQLHGESDRLIPISHAKLLHESATNNEVKHFISVPGLGHNGALSEATFAELMNKVKSTL